VDGVTVLECAIAAKFEQKSFSLSPSLWAPSSGSGSGSSSSSCLKNEAGHAYPPLPISSRDPSCAWRAPHLPAPPGLPEIQSIARSKLTAEAGTLAPTVAAPLARGFTHVVPPPCFEVLRRQHYYSLFPVVAVCRYTFARKFLGYWPVLAGY
jgi:hypothetical protein